MVCCVGGAAASVGAASARVVLARPATPAAPTAAVVVGPTRLRPRTGAG